MTGPALAIAIASSLADPDGSEPFVSAVDWVEGVALGTVATSVALIAVAGVGFAMFTGRLPIRRGAMVITGCFILFGAPAIAEGILSAVRSGTLSSPPVARPTPSIASPLPAAKPTQTYDPYAGAAVPLR